MKNKLDKIKSILKGGKRLLIFNHYNPDPDSITAALILSEMVKHFGVKSKCVYTGTVSYSKNLAMIMYLNLKLHPFKPGEEKRFDRVAVVDTQKGLGNNGVPSDLFPHFTFDHHPKAIGVGKPKHTQLVDVRTRYGSAATIVLEYYLALKLPITRRIATAYCYTINAETDHFIRKYNEIDVKFYRQLIQYADLKLIANIERTKRPVEYFNILSRVIKNHQKHGPLLTCNLGKINNMGFLHEIANFMLTMDKIEYVAITGIQGKIRKLCCRSSSRRVHIGNIVRATLKDYGSGGGHETMAAGEFSVDELTVLNEFKSYLKKFEIIK